MKFSVLTPSYGYGRFMSDCVRSVLMQEGVDVEHVVMDGQSRDETEQVLRSLSDDPRLHWVSEPDAGQSDALNKAFLRSTGEWIGWLNADEFYLPGTLESVAACIAENPDTDVVYGDFIEVDADGRLDRLVSEHKYSKKSLRSLCYIASCTTFIRRDAIPERLWDINCPSMMDWDLFLELSGRGKKFRHLKRPLAAFRVHPGQVTSSAVAQSPQEYALLRDRHGIPTGPVAVKAVKALGRTAHIARKVFEGGYIREIRASRLKGRSLRWFDEVDAVALRSLGATSARTAR